MTLTSAPCELHEGSRTQIQKVHVFFVTLWCCRQRLGVLWPEDSCKASSESQESLLETFLDHLGSDLAILAPYWRSLGPSWLKMAQPCFSMLAPSRLQLGYLGDLGAPLGYVKLPLGSCWRIFGYLMAMLAPPELQVVHPGPIWMLPWATLSFFSAHVGASLAITRPCCRHLESICFLLMLDADAA